MHHFRFGSNFKEANYASFLFLNSFKKGGPEYAFRRLFNNKETKRNKSGGI
jgi:hypothetical protein